MQYMFNSKIAEIYGVDEAIIIENLYYWIRKNELNNKHFHDGDYWTYNSSKAFSKIFTFWTSRQIERILRNLEKKGAIKTGNFNSTPYDRTKWYALSKSIKSIYGGGQIDLPKCENGKSKSDEPIPDNKPDTKTNNKQDNYSEDFEEFWEHYPRKTEKLNIRINTEKFMYQGGNELPIDTNGPGLF